MPRLQTICKRIASFNSLLRHNYGIICSLHWTRGLSIFISKNRKRIGQNSERSKEQKQQKSTRMPIVVLKSNQKSK